MYTLEPYFGPRTDDFGKAGWKLPDTALNPTAKAAVDLSMRHHDGLSEAKALVEKLLLDGVRMPE